MAFLPRKLDNNDKFCCYGSFLQCLIPRYLPSGSSWSKRETGKDLCRGSSQLWFNCTVRAAGGVHAPRSVSWLGRWFSCGDQVSLAQYGCSQTQGSSRPTGRTGASDAEIIVVPPAPMLWWPWDGWRTRRPMGLSVTVATFAINFKDLLNSSKLEPYWTFFILGKGSCSIFCCLDFCPGNVKDFPHVWAVIHSLYS